MSGFTFFVERILLVVHWRCVMCKQIEVTRLAELSGESGGG